MKGKDNGYDTKVAAPASTPTIGKGARQPVTGKLGGDMKPMPGSKGKSVGGSVKTVDSQPITGKVGRGMTAMGSGGLLPGKV